MQNYYLIQDDTRVAHKIYPTHFTNLKLPFEKMPPVQICEVNAVPSSEYVDWMLQPAMLVSDRLKRILEKYNLYARFKSLYLIDKTNDQQSLYWFSKIPRIESLSELTEFNPHDQSLKKLVLDRAKVKGNHIFKIKGIRESYCIISEDVAESLLRRGINGFLLIKIALNELEVC
ncbi:hypothetical protein D3C77_364480 [compost metagenome]